MNIYIKNGGGFYMENVFNVKYNEKMDRLEITKNVKGNKFFDFMKKNKFISIVFSSFLLFSVINFSLIYFFL